MHVSACPSSVCMQICKLHRHLHWDYEPHVLLSMHCLCSRQDAKRYVLGLTNNALIAQGGQQGSDGSSVPLRGEIHVLMVGDPGIGKSKLLQASVCFPTWPSPVPDPMPDDASEQFCLVTLKAG